ncbi:retinol dehydrogenase 11-like isoform X1 [Microplitis mediator]|uniref:retinol dehydrogenase 11-like isoform X1 n=1 Tax=Microplitis mediator TaxID=375433 RepID=UPI0025536BD6|nr:retinol dehydrogenase 11-like isoform X1 [Microplitis mediator]
MWPFSRTCQSKVRLVGKTVVITGANTGIGKETARDLYRRGARVILACRDLTKANAAVEELKNTPPSKPDREQFQGEPGELVVCKLNLCSFSSVRECAKTLNDTEPNIHILINNAGVMMCPFGKTEDGFETQLQSNHLGHFLLTLLLLPKIKNSTPARIINVSSMAHSVLGGDIHFDDINLEKSYSPLKAYGQSKLANVLFTTELSRRLKEAKIEGITVYSLHPGVISTELGRHLDTAFVRGARVFWKYVSAPFVKTPELGAQTTLHCALDEAAGKETGMYYKECAVTTPSARARDAELAQKLWDESCRMVGLEPKENLAEMMAMLGRDASAK